MATLLPHSGLSAPAIPGPRGRSPGGEHARRQGPRGSAHWHLASPTRAARRRPHRDPLPIVLKPALSRPESAENSTIGERGRGAGRACGGGRARLRSSAAGASSERPRTYRGPRRTWQLASGNRRTRRCGDSRTTSTPIVRKSALSGPASAENSTIGEGWGAGTTEAGQPPAGRGNYGADPATDDRAGGAGQPRAWAEQPRADGATDEGAEAAGQARAGGAGQPRADGATHDRAVAAPRRTNGPTPRQTNGPAPP